MNSFSLPPTEKRKQYELRALALRDFAGLGDYERLDPFALARFAKLMVVDFDQVEGLSPESRAHLLGPAAEQWSGGACSRPLPNGWRIVILNPAHGIRRNRATLMEEIAHVFLGHQPNRLAAVGSGSKVRQAASAGRNSTESATIKDGALARDYHKADEEAAYAVGAAALVPYPALRRMVQESRSADQIARRFGVSWQLVEYRIKVTHLWAQYKSSSASRRDDV